MSMSDNQWTFLRNLADLIEFIADSGWKATGGDLFRSYAEQERVHGAGLSKAKPGESRHGFRMAIDLNFWDETGAYLPKLPLTREQHDEKMRFIADYWEFLNPKNKAGLNFKSLYDPYHFERGE